MTLRKAVVFAVQSCSLWLVFIQPIYPEKVAIIPIPMYRHFTLGNDRRELSQAFWKGNTYYERTDVSHEAVGRVNHGKRNPYSVVFKFHYGDKKSHYQILHIHFIFQ